MNRTNVVLAIAAVSVALVTTWVACSRQPVATAVVLQPDADPPPPVRLQQGEALRYSSTVVSSP